MYKYLEGTQRTAMMLCIKNVGKIRSKFYHTTDAGIYMIIN